MPRSILAHALAAAILVIAGAVPYRASADAAPSVSIDVATGSVPLDEDDRAKTRIGRLVYRIGFVLASNEGRFGGWSDLAISADGARLLAISDRGTWLSARLSHDDAGTLARLDDVRLGALRDQTGHPLKGLAGDAEGLATTADGSLFVSFERRHRIWWYPPADPPFSEPPRPLPMPGGLDDAPANGGIEALVPLPGGRLFALAEAFYQGKANVGWVGDGQRWQRLTYQAGPDFKPTAMTRLPDGDVLVLERRFTQTGLPGVRIVRLPVADIRPGARLKGEELALIEPPLTIDNFEGIAARTGPRGETLVYLLSDDNFFFLQRTLLLQFELLGD